MEISQAKLTACALALLSALVLAYGVKQSVAPSSTRYASGGMAMVMREEARQEARWSFVVAAGAAIASFLAWRSEDEE